MKKNALRSLVARIVVSLTFAAAPWANGQVAIATGDEEGAYHRIGHAISDVMTTQGHTSLKVIASNGSLDNIRLVREGGADFALIQGALDADLSGLLGIAKIDRQYAHVVVPTSSPIRSFGDFKGKRLGVGPEGGGTSLLCRRLVDFCRFDTPPELVVAEWEDTVELLSSGEMDGAFLVFGLFAPVVDRLLASGEFRLVPIHEAEAMARYFPGIHAESIPKQSYGPNKSQPPRLAGDLPTIAVDTLLVTADTTSRRRVREIMQALYSVDVVKNAHLVGLSEETGRKVADLPLHSGADAYYRRNDPVSSDRFEIASFFLAGLITAASIFHYLVGRHQRAKTERLRNAIVPFFEGMLDYGAQVQDATDAETLRPLIASMMSAHREAEQAWLAGKLDTEHMENLYAVFNIRSRNAFSKILELQNKALLDRIGRLEVALKRLAQSKPES